MKIIIMGAGKVGEVLCEDLSVENHDITLLEIDEDTLQDMMHKNDINTILGNGASYEIQKEAGVDTADVYIAVTDNDELNLIACVLAKSLGAKNTIARVRKPEYSNLSGVMRDNLGVTILLNPELQAAEKVARLISFPQANSFETFITKKAPIVELKVNEDSALVGKMLIEFRSVYKNLIVCAVNDKGEVFTPKGTYSIKPGVHLYVTGPYAELVKLFKDNGQYNSKINSILIIGGGLITRYILKVLSYTKIKFKVIEIDKKKAESLAAEFPDVEVINDDGTSMSTLIEQRAENYDAMIALTGIDEENIIISMVAQSMGIKKTLTKINRTELLELGDTVGLQSVITPKRVVADSIIQKVRALNNSTGSNVEALYTLADEKIEALQFRVMRESKITNKPIKELNIKDGNLIAYIYRKGEVIFPTGNDEILPHDRVILITRQERLTDIDEILL